MGRGHRRDVGHLHIPVAVVRQKVLVELVRSTALQKKLPCTGFVDAIKEIIASNYKLMDKETCFEYLSFKLASSIQ